jgi:hypothetical protein
VGDAPPPPGDRAGSDPDGAQCDCLHCLLLTACCLLPTTYCPSDPLALMTSIIFGLLAMSSTLAGNLTMLGSVANLIV